MSEYSNTGTYQMLLATGNGMTRQEERAWKLARDAKDPNWRSYMEQAKGQLLAEAGLSRSQS